MAFPLLTRLSSLSPLRFSYWRWVQTDLKTSWLGAVCFSWFRGSAGQFFPSSWLRWGRQSRMAWVTYPSPGLDSPCGGRPPLGVQTGLFMWRVGGSQRQERRSLHAPVLDLSWDPFCDVLSAKGGPMGHSLDGRRSPCRKAYSDGRTSRGHVVQWAANKVV